MRKLLPLLSAGLTLCAALLWANRLRLAPIDDAYISFRAAVNLAHGDGPVFNPGERVESATSPLWVFLLAAADKLGADPLSSWAALSFLAAAAAAALAALCAYDLAGPLASVIAGVFLAALPQWSGWACVGMEVPLAGLCAIAAVLTRSGTLLALATCARPEAIFLLPALLIGSDRRKRLLLTSLVPIALLAIARHAYFGAWVPNTYVAKRDGLGFLGLLRGLQYLGAFVAANLALTLATLRSSLRPGAPRVLAIACIGFALAVAWDGGDHFPLSRLLAPMLPIACALFAAELVKLPRKLLPFAIALTLLPPLLLPRALRFENPWSGWRGLETAAQTTAKVAETAEALAALPPGRIATVMIGAIGYFSQRPVLDLVGLADARIARSPHLPGVAPGHDHADTDYVLQQRPELVLTVPELSPGPPDDRMEEKWLRVYDHWFRAARLLHEDPRFRALYEPLDVPLGDGRYLRIWRLRH